MKRTKKWPRALGGLMLLAAVPLCLACFLIALGRLEHGQAEEKRRQLEDSIRRAAVACYAAEGAYPAGMDVLTERWGIQIDEDRYTVFYDAVSSNLVPDITVLDNKK